jgi:bacillolysin
MPGFDSFHFHVTPAGDTEEFRGIAPAETTRFASDEAAARFYLDQALGGTQAEEFRDIVAPDEGALVPELDLVDTQRSPFMENRVVRFRQVHRGVPVFGSRVVVELEESQGLVSIDTNTAHQEASPVAGLSPAEALRVVTRELKDVPDLAPIAPQLVYFHRGEDDDFVLAYFIQDVHVPPQEEEPESWDDHVQLTLDSLPPDSFHYVVDANSGAVLLAYPAQPSLQYATLLRGTDDLGDSHDFHGSKPGSSFEMADPDRSITTHDLAFGNVDTLHGLPAPVSATTADWGTSNPAAVSAHVNATRVHDFYESVLHRDGIDGKGMALASIVNCTTSSLSNPPEWVNAQWRKDRMVYGQQQRSDGSWQSLATFLEVIAHELTHGVTASTAFLVYDNEPGALNESLSDIFGVIVNNWYLHGEGADVDLWNWEIGAGLGGGGEPLRDLSDPGRRKCPDHMDHYVHTNADHGGVHKNSAIHSLAAVELLRSRDASGARQLTPRLVAHFYYSALLRITAQATFSECRQQLIDAVAAYYAGFPDMAAEKVGAVEAAYDAVGIT